MSESERPSLRWEIYKLDGGVWLQCLQHRSGGARRWAARGGQFSRCRDVAAASALLLSPAGARPARRTGGSIMSATNHKLPTGSWTNQRVDLPAELTLSVDIIDLFPVLVDGGRGRIW